MKAAFIGAILAALLFIGDRHAEAQVYDFYYYWDGIQYQQYSPQYDLYSYGNVNQYPQQLYDPYYQLHVLHYQLYLPQYQPYLYQPCCFAGGVVIPSRRARVRPLARGVLGPSLPAATALLPAATAPLPRAVTPSAPVMKRR
jgi:hypothetical protein